jgi:hypothetical protein
MEGFLPLLLLAAILYFAWRLLRPRRQAATVRTEGTVQGPGFFECEVVGESKYQHHLAHITGGKTANGHELKKQAILVLEDENDNDKNAVCVYIDGLRVGYLSRRLAKGYRDRLKGQNLPNGHYRCDALIVGGWDRGGGDKGHFGVRLDLPIEAK